MERVVKRIVWGVAVFTAANVSGIDLEQYVRLEGTGEDQTVSHGRRFEVEPDTPYVLSCKVRSPDGGGRGVAAVDPCGVSMYAKGTSGEWTHLVNALMTAGGMRNASCEFRQWHVPGVTEFKDAKLIKAKPRFRKIGGTDIGFGESIDGNVYRFNTHFSSDSHIHSRPLKTYRNLSVGSTVAFWGKAEMVFSHFLEGRGLLSAQFGIALDGDAAGAVRFSVSRDGVEWRDVSVVSNAGIHRVDVPASMLPAGRIFTRISGTGGKSAKLRQYMFDARVDGPPAFGFGATDYLDAQTGEVLLSVKPWSYLDDVESGGLVFSHSDGIDCWAQSSGRKVFRGRPVPQNKIRAVAVSAAGNEAESVQLVIRPKRNLKGVKVSAQVEGGDVDVEVRRVGYVLVDINMDDMGARGLWPDPIFPQSNAGCDIPSCENQPFWVTVKPRKGAKAGLRRGRIKVTADSGKVSFALPLEVRVYGFDMPDKMSCKSSFGLSMSTVYRYHKAKTDQDKAAVAEKYLDMFARHHITPYQPAPCVPSGPWTDKWSKTADRSDSKPTFTWDEWDTAIEKAFNYYNFTSLKVSIRGKGGMDSRSRKRGSVRRLNGAKAPDALYETYMERYLKAIEAHFEEKGWLDKAYIYSFDEPKPEDIEYMKEDLARIKKYAPKIRRMVTVEPRDDLHGYVNLWCPITEAFDRKKSRARQAAGDEVWWYITFASRSPKVNEHIEHSGVDMRVWLWQTWMEKITGILIWETAYWNGKYFYPNEEHLQNPYKDAMCWTQRKPWNSGEGRYVYPPLSCFETKDTVIEEPVDSIRFEMLREGLEDYEYFAILKRLDASSVLLDVPRDVATSLDDYSTDPGAMERHRVRIAEAIEKLARRASGSKAGRR